MMHPAVDVARLREVGRFDGRHVLKVAGMLLASFAGACLTGLLAQARIPLWPVPVTGQVLAVLICGALLGSGYGTLSQAIYIVLGAAGVPWFAGGIGGMAVIMGPTGGYLVGFAVAALFLGTLTETSRSTVTLRGQMALMSIALGMIYLFGALHLMLALRLTLRQAVFSGVIVFLPVDALKVVLAALFTSAVLARRRHSMGEGR